MSIKSLFLPGQEVQLVEQVSCCNRDCREWWTSPHRWPADREKNDSVDLLVPLHVMQVVVDGELWLVGIQCVVCRIIQPHKSHKNLLYHWLSDHGSQKTTILYSLINPWWTKVFCNDCRNVNVFPLFLQRNFDCFVYFTLKFCLKYEWKPLKRTPK